MNIKPQTRTTQNSNDNYDLVCFSHLRWDFVYQRPQHLFSRFAKVFRTFFIEEPIQASGENLVECNWKDDKLCVLTPCIDMHVSEEEQEAQVRALLSHQFKQSQIRNYIFWYYTPMALAYSDHFDPHVIVYDCMDELSAFKFASPRMKQLEKDLFELADLVFTGGFSLYEAKKNFHANIYPFPSSIDKDHFGQARKTIFSPGDQALIPHPRLGFYGAIDERFDLELLDQISDARPEWNFIIIGPVVKINPGTLPQKSNIRYLGSKSYQELPAYLSGWDIALIPFAKNESTRYISPSKTPEYLAAGIPVISTSIKDVVEPYATNNLVQIADAPDEFIAAAEHILHSKNRKTWLSRVDKFLQEHSWDRTWKSMMQLMQAAVRNKPNVGAQQESYV